MSDTTVETRKAPKWALERIRALEMQRDAAVRQLREFCDSQTPSQLYLEELVCTQDGGPRTYRRYLQGYRLVFNLSKNEHEERRRINLAIELDNPEVLRITGALCGLVVRPSSSNQIRVTLEKA